jgi:hypothetical protein
VTIERDLANEAAQALRWAMRLRLTPAGWSAAERAMGMLEDAFAAGDADMVRDAVFELDLLSRRIKEKLGQDSAEAPASPKQRDRANELIHQLGPDTEDIESRRENAE